MKTFLVAVSSFCLCGILLCFLAYATGNFPIPKVTKLPSVPVPPQQATTVETDPLCSPCVERMASLLEMMEQVVTPLDREADGWNGVSPEQREKAKQLFDQYGTEEGLRRLRGSDPDAARKFEQERRPLPAREVAGKTESSTQ